MDVKQSFYISGECFQTVTWQRQTDRRFKSKFFALYLFEAYWFVLSIQMYLTIHHKTTKIDPILSSNTVTQNIYRFEGFYGAHTFHSFYRQVIFYVGLVDNLISVMQFHIFTRPYYEKDQWRFWEFSCPAICFNLSYDVVIYKEEILIH